jgi:hypothetical protein
MATMLFLLPSVGFINSNFHHYFSYLDLVGTLYSTTRHYVSQIEHGLIHAIIHLTTKNDLKHIIRAKQWQHQDMPSHLDTCRDVIHFVSAYMCREWRQNIGAGRQQLFYRDTLFHNRFK